MVRVGPLAAAQTLLQANKHSNIPCVWCGGGRFLGIDAVNSVLGGHWAVITEVVGHRPSSSVVAFYP